MLTEWRIPPSVRFLSDFWETPHGAEIRLELRTSLCEGGAAIIRGGRPHLDELLSLEKVLGLPIFKSGRLGESFNFEVNPFADSLSETTTSGGFHTDFATSNTPPKYVALQCVETDPRHPFYGRNQIAHMTKIVERLFQIVPHLKKEDLYELIIPHSFGGILKDIHFLTNHGGEDVLRFHASFSLETPKAPKVNGVPFSRLISAIGSDVACDFVLEKGDIAVFSNWKTLHKRGECSVQYDGRWKGRYINSVRFV